MRTTLCLVIVMLLTVAAVADERTVALDDEAKLSKSITLSLRAETLKNVLSEIQKATGVRLLVQREIAEDKATVWVKDQPAREVLRSIAHCFNLCWSPSPTTDTQYLRLWMDRGYLTSMHHLEYQDYLSIVGMFDTELKATAEYVRSGQEFTLDPAMMDKLQTKDYAEYIRLGKRNDILQHKNCSAMVLQYLALSDKQRESLFAGSHVKISTGEVSAEAIKTWPDAKSFDFAIDRTVSGFILRCAARPGQGTFSIASAYFDNSPYEKQADMAAKQTLADPAWDKELPPPAPDAPVDTSLHPGEGSAVALATMSDGMLDVAKRANIPVVAQYVSEYNGATEDWTKGTVSCPASTAKKIGERLAELGKQHTFVIISDGEFLLGRSLLWHRQRLREVPEEKIRASQKEFSGLPLPTFGGCVDLAAQPWEQIRGAMGNWRNWFGPQYPRWFSECSYALKLYGSLTASQQQWLLSGRELIGSALTPDQQAVFMSAFEVRENPTYEKAVDQDWPAKASFSIGDGDFVDSTLFAVAKMLPIDQMPVEQSLLHIPEGTPEKETAGVLNKQIEALLPSLKAKLLDKVANDHPEIHAKDVSFYRERSCVFNLKLADQTRTCLFVYSDRVK